MDPRSTAAVTGLGVFVLIIFIVFFFQYVEKDESEDDDTGTETGEEVIGCDPPYPDSAIEAAAFSAGKCESLRQYNIGSLLPDLRFHSMNHITDVLTDKVSSEIGIANDVSKRYVSPLVYYDSDQCLKYGDGVGYTATIEVGQVRRKVKVTPDFEDTNTCLERATTAVGGGPYPIDICMDSNDEGCKEKLQKFGTDCIRESIDLCTDNGGKVFKSGGSLKCVLGDRIEDVQYSDDACEPYVLANLPDTVETRKAEWTLEPSMRTANIEKRCMDYCPPDLGTEQDGVCLMKEPKVCLFQEDQLDLEASDLPEELCGVKPDTPIPIPLCEQETINEGDWEVFQNTMFDHSDVSYDGFVVSIENAKSRTIAEGKVAFLYGNGSAYTITFKNGLNPDTASRQNTSNFDLYVFNGDMESAPDYGVGYTLMNDIAPTRWPNTYAVSNDEFCRDVCERHASCIGYFTSNDINACYVALGGDEVEVYNTPGWNFNLREMYTSDNIKNIGNEMDSGENTLDPREIDDREICRWGGVSHYVKNEDTEGYDVNNGYWATHLNRDFETFMTAKPLKCCIAKCDEDKKCQTLLYDSATRRCWKNKDSVDRPEIVPSLDTKSAYSKKLTTYTKYPTQAFARRKYMSNATPIECKRLCDQDQSCIGYSASVYGNDVVGPCFTMADGSAGLIRSDAGFNTFVKDGSGLETITRDYCTKSIDDHYPDNIQEYDGYEYRYKTILKRAGNRIQPNVTTIEGCKQTCDVRGDGCTGFMWGLSKYSCDPLCIHTTQPLDAQDWTHPHTPIPELTGYPWHSWKKV